MRRLNGEQFKKVYDAIIDAFDVDELVRILRFADIKLTDTNLNAGESEAVHSLLDEAERKGRMSRLLTALKESRPDDEHFRRTIDEALAVIVIQDPVGPPTEVHTQRTDLAKRKILRWLIPGIIGSLVVAVSGYVYFYGSAKVGPGCQRGTSTVYIQYPDESFREQVDSLRKSVNDFGFTVPSPENVGRDKSPSQMQIRYSTAASAADAKSLQCVISYYYKDVTINMIKSAEPNFEVWFAANQ